MLDPKHALRVSGGGVEGVPLLAGKVTTQPPGLHFTSVLSLENWMPLVQIVPVVPFLPQIPRNSYRIHYDDGSVLPSSRDDSGCLVVAL